MAFQSILKIEQLEIRTFLLNCFKMEKGFREEQEEFEREVKRLREEEVNVC